MTEYLDLPEIIQFNKRFTGDGAARDIGAIEAACHRPRATAYGEDAYPTIWEKAAALMHSLARNHGFVDGNKRTAWSAAWSFLRINGHEIDRVHEDDTAAAAAFVRSVAIGEIDDVHVIANELVKYARR